MADYSITASQAGLSDSVFLGYPTGGYAPSSTYRMIVTAGESNVQIQTGLAGSFVPFSLGDGRDRVVTGNYTQHVRAGQSIRLNVLDYAGEPVTALFEGI